MNAAWSKPCHGVTHLGEFSLRQHWVTVNEYRTFATLLRWFPGCAFNPEETQHANTAEAKAAGEAYMKEHA